MWRGHVFLVGAGGEICIW